MARPDLPLPPPGAEPEQAGHGRSTWHWALAIPLAALAIPLVAILGDAVPDLLQAVQWPLTALVTVGSATWGGRYLLDHKHELRMKEIEAERELAALERERLTTAERVLELDTGEAALRDALRRPARRDDAPSRAREEA